MQQWGEAPRVQLVALDWLKPAEWNPRTISEERFKNLVRSLELDPDWMLARPVVANKDGTIIAGNQRFRAAQHLKWRTVPVIFVDVPDEVAKRRAIQDNRSWGEWDSEMLAELVYTMHIDGEQDTSTLGFSDRELSELLGSVSGEGEEAPPSTPPLVCRACGQIIQHPPEEL